MKWKKKRIKKSMLDTNKLSTENTYAYAVDILLVFVRLTFQSEVIKIEILVRMYWKTWSKAFSGGV